MNFGPITPSTGVGVGGGGIGVGVGVGVHGAVTSGPADANCGFVGRHCTTCGLAIVCAASSCAAHKQRKTLSITFFFTNSPCELRDCQEQNCRATTWQTGWN